MKKHTSYIITFILSAITCIFAWQLPSYAFPIIFMPLVGTNLFLPFYIISSGEITHKWQLMFFFVVPYASILYIFADGVPMTFMYFRDKIKKLN